MNMSGNEGREKILGRIREALQLKAPVPGVTHGKQPELFAAPHATDNAREWLPKVGNTPVEIFDAFKRIAVDLKAEVIVVPNRNGMADVVKAMRDAEKWTSLGTHSGELTSYIADELGLPALITDKGYDTKALEKCPVGITQCDALVAQTGSVLVTARSAGGRGLSVLPPHHVVLARRSQLLPDLPAAFDLLYKKYGNAYPSFISFITGPSRTGDIERILVLGAHGPKRLTIVVIEEE